MTFPAELRARRITASLSGLLILGAALVLRAIDPARGGIFPVCPFHALTGFYCPGCGSSRALHQLLNGHLGAAIGYNPLAVLALPFLGSFFIYYAAAAFLGKPGTGAFLKPAWIWTILGLVLAFGILRNIPAWPFTWLAPG